MCIFCTRGKSVLTFVHPTTRSSCSICSQLLPSNGHGVKKGRSGGGRGSHGAALMSIAMLVLTLFLFLPLTTLGAEVDVVCQKGVTGFVGATFPKGDIYLKEGDKLAVYCRLNPSLFPKNVNYTANHIHFSFAKTNISRNLMKTTVINETTALLEVEGMNASSPHLSCEVIAPNGRTNPVCQNEIKVGYLSKEVENFECLAPEWKSLNCTWTKPYNPIPTKYELQMLITQGRQVAEVTRCPETTVTATSCSWGLRTEPAYRANQHPIYLRINGTNILNPTGTTWIKQIDHWKIVIPESPEEVSATNKSDSSAVVVWSFEKFKDFRPGLVHKVTVCIANFLPQQCHIYNTTTVKGSKSSNVSVPLPYAYVNYTVEVSMRSANAVDVPQFWSKPTTIVIISDARRPPFPPRVDVGSYESVKSTEKFRDVFIYWERVPELFKSGPGFHYAFTVWEDGQKLDPLPGEVQVTPSHAKFPRLWSNRSYRFQIASSNDVGSSSNSSEILVPKANKVPQLPSAVSKLDYINGSMVLSWNYPDTPSFAISSFTVFRCDNVKPRPYQCQGLLTWDTVSPKERSRIYDKLAHNVSYQFAVAANADNVSSGMAWASCTLLHDQLPHKLEKVAKRPSQSSNGDTEISIEWQMDCSYKPGVIEGFKISYCLAENGKCKGSEFQEGVNDANATSFTLIKLSPCSTYLISVSINTSEGENEKSDGIQVTTSQSAPSNPPTVKVGSINSTGVVLSITQPPPLNGIIEKYRVKYTSMETGEQKVMSLPSPGASPHEEVPNTCFSSRSQTEVIEELEIEDLLSNSDYRVTVATCTVKCSTESESVPFRTKIGYTNLTASPRVKADGNNLHVQWSVPDKLLRGPIHKFEILMYESGEPGEMEELDYSNDTSVYDKTFPCDSEAYAEVRTVTITPSGNLYSPWSRSAAVTCGSGGSIAMWLAVLMGATVIFSAIGIASVKVYQKVKEMREVNVKLPPGLAVQDLARHPKIRKDSDGDMDSFGKESSTYLQMTTTAYSEDTNDHFKDLTESQFDQENRNKRGCIHRGEMSYDNKVFSEDLQGEDMHHHAVLGSDGKSVRDTVDSAVTLDNLQINILNDVQEESQVGTSGETLHRQPNNVERASLILSDCSSHQHSPLSTTRQPLLRSDSSFDASPTPEAIGAPQVQHYSNLNPQDLHDMHPGCDVGESVNSLDENGDSSRSPSSSSSLSGPTTMEEGSSSFGMLPPIPLFPVPSSSSTPTSAASWTPTPSNPGSSYVKLSQMMPEQGFLNGDSPPLAIDRLQQTTPYCQVGIMLDSN